MNLKQLKLTNGDELICEVLDQKLTDNDMIVVRKALRIVSVDDVDESMRFYMFKPWQLMNNDPETMHVLNSTHIISQTVPGKVALEYYTDVIKEMSEEDEPEVYFKDSEGYDHIDPPSDTLH